MITRLFFLILTGMAVLGLCGCARPPLQTEMGWDAPAVEAFPSTGPSEAIGKGAYYPFVMACLASMDGKLPIAEEYLSQALTADPESAYLHMEMADLLKEEKRPLEALPYAEKASALAPQEVEPLALLGELFSLTRQEDRAAAAYLKALEISPGDQQVRILLTTLYIRTNALDEALTQLEVLVSQNPDLVIAHYYRGRILFEKGRHKEAEKALLGALNLNPHLEPALFDLGTLYQVTNRHEEALRLYERLLSLYPDNLNVRERMVDLYFKVGQEGRATEQMSAIKAASKPGDPSRQALGLLYLRYGKIEESIQELEFIVAASPHDDKMRYYLATAYAENEETAKALEHFRAMKPESTYYINAQLQIAYLLDTLGKKEEARAIVDKLLASAPEKVEIYLLLSGYHENKGEFAKGIAVLREGLEKVGPNAELHFRLGILHDKSGDRKACILEIQNAIARDPDHAEALNYLGYTYADMGIRLDEAQGLIQRALALKPESGYILDSMGWVHFQQGRFAESVHYLEKAVHATPDDPTISEHLGDAYVKTKQYQKALEVYRRTLNLKPQDRAEIKKKILLLERLLKRSP